MFASSLNLFKDIPCPTTRINGEKCNIPFCIFSHDTLRESPRKEEIEKTAVPPTVRKRRRIIEPEATSSNINDGKVKSVERSEKKIEKVHSARQITSNTSENRSDQRLDQRLDQRSDNRPSQRSVNVPNQRSDQRSNQRSDQRIDQRSTQRSNQRAEKELHCKLTPRPVLPYSPAQLSQRVQFIKVIYNELVTSKSTDTPKLEAVEAEYQTAKSSVTVTYPVNIRKLIADIRAGRYKNKEQLEKLAAEEAERKEDNELNKLILPLDILQKRKYVTNTVISSEIPQGFTTVCQRCGTKFDTTKKIKTTCVFHLLRREYDPQKGKRSDIFPCCSQPLGESNGCQFRDFHVWKLEDPALMSSIIPFTRTPERETDKTLFAVGLDCEMGYTTFGMELIRLTVVDWRTRETILDRYVYPYGDILDLNTRFSGISDISQGTINADGTKNNTVTFKEARELLFQYVNWKTIIVGHGLENDLNALRLIHHQIVDTAILYPSLKESRTYSLKQLSFKYLGKIIQLGEHDSSEDSLAAIDIVKENIKRSQLEEKKLQI